MTTAMAFFCATRLPSTTLLLKSHRPFLSPVISDETSKVSFRETPVHGIGGGKERRRRRGLLTSATRDLRTAGPSFPESNRKCKKLRILVAGAGIGGLVLALAAKNKGFDVVVLEKDISAIRGEGMIRGPIQIQSNALAVLEAIDSRVAEEVMDEGRMTGDKINGFADGISGTWYLF